MGKMAESALSGLQAVLPELVWKDEDGMGGLGSQTLTMLL